MRETNKSLYKPSYPKKYLGNPNMIVCRSSWERRFCRWCDLNENILEWGSEEFFIPYYSPLDGKRHRYYPDFFIKVKESSGLIKKYIIEVKPEKQTRPPNPNPKRKSKSWLYEAKTYAVNQAKWKAAEEFCEINGVEFKIITEKELGIV
jgi:hypothetical protein